MIDISSRADYTDRDRRFARQRQDWLYVPLEPSPPVFGIRRGDIAAAVAIVLLGCLAFPAADLLVYLMAGS